MRERPTTQPKRRTVLIIDDDERVRGALAQLLRWAGTWQVIGEAGDSVGALRLADALHPDVILLDLWLPDGSGLELLPRFQRIAPPPVVFVLTVETDELFQRQALRLGASGYISKTTPPLEILAALHALNFTNPPREEP